MTRPNMWIQESEEGSQVVEVSANPYSGGLPFKLTTGSGDHIELVLPKGRCYVYVNAHTLSDLLNAVIHRVDDD